MIVQQLRPHHLLCCAAFEGRGYNKKFIKQLKTVQAAVLSDAEIELVEDIDIVCKACPNLKSGECVSGQGLAAEMDSKVLALIDRPQIKGFCAPVSDYYEKLVKLKDRQLAEVCAACEWKRNNICKISIDKISGFMKRISNYACDS